MKGLYNKYDIDQGSFLLKPANDPAARAALWEYARVTDNRKLATDLNNWMLRLTQEDNDEDQSE
jgi:hypothetical protein